MRLFFYARNRKQISNPLKTLTFPHVVKLMVFKYLIPRNASGQALGLLLKREGLMVLT